MGFREKGAHFSIESEGEKVLHGNRTNAKFLEVFGDRWAAFPETERNQAIQDVNSIQTKDARKRRARTHWGLDDDAADRFA